MKKKSVLEEYVITVSQDENADGFYYIAQYKELGTIGNGETHDEAIKDLINVSFEAIKLAKERGLTLPTPVTRKYSGKVSLRMPKHLHCATAERAVIEGVSINQLIVSALSWYVGTKSVEDLDDSEDDWEDYCKG